MQPQTEMSEDIMFSIFSGRPVEDKKGVSRLAGITIEKVRIFSVLNIAFTNVHFLHGWETELLNKKVFRIV